MNIQAMMKQAQKLQKDMMTSKKKLIKHYILENQKWLQLKCMVISKYQKLS